MHMCRCIQDGLKGKCQNETSTIWFLLIILIAGFDLQPVLNTWWGTERGRKKETGEDGSDQCSSRHSVSLGSL